MTNALPTPLKVRIVIEYRRDVPERYEVSISPVSAADVCVRLRSPVVGETICQLQPWPGGADGLAMCAVRAVVGCFFGGIYAAPRIVGAPDWLKVTLDVALAGEQRKRRLLLLELAAESSMRATFARTRGSSVLRDEAVRLCPEDADPVYAVTRLAMATAKLSSEPEHAAPKLLEPRPARPVPARAALPPSRLAAAAA